jgi:uncharacterized membrane protein
MKANTTYIKKLTLSLPVNVDKDDYRLRIRVDDRDGDTTQEDYVLSVDAPRNAIQIKDVIFSPSEVMAGRSLLTTVRLKNIGSNDQNDGVKVMVSIPELGVEAADYIDEVDEEDSVTSQELYLRIPSCVKEGTYDVLVSVEYKDGDKIVTTEKSIVITEGESCEAAAPAEGPKTEKTVITIGPLSQDITKGQGGVIYPVMFTNSGKESKAYAINVDGYADWANVVMQPGSVVVVQPGETKSVYIYVSAKDTASAGEHMFTVTATSGGEVLKQVTFKSNVQGSAQGNSNQPSVISIKRGLEISLLVLIVLLVIVGLIVALTRIRGDRQEGSEEQEEETKSYY